MEITYRSIAKRRMHTTLYFSPYLTTTPSSIEIVNWEIFIPNLNWTKNTFCGKKIARRNIWHIKTSWKIMIWIKQNLFMKFIKCTNKIEQVWSKQCVNKMRLLFSRFDNRLQKSIIHGDLFCSSILFSP